MPDDREFDRLFHCLDEAAKPERAPSPLKARIYSALIREQQESGSLLSLSKSRAAGRDLCIFEKALQMAPVGTKVESSFLCRVCHARIVAENIENAPIFWAHCPYASFQNRG